MASNPIPSHDDLVAAVRRFAPADLLAALAKVSNAQLSEVDNPLWPRPWNAAALARESVAYGNQWRSEVVTDQMLHRLDWLALNQADPVLNDTRDDKWDSFAVRTAYQQVPFTSTSGALGEVGRLMEVCNRSDAEFSAIMPKLEIISEQTLLDLLGMPLSIWARAVFCVYSVARVNHGVIDVGAFAAPDLARFGLTSEQVLEVFHRYLARELADLRGLCADSRHADPAMRRLDFNPLVNTPFVGLGSGGYVAPSMHLVEQRMSLTALYYLGHDKYGEAFTRDLGKLIEAYVVRQLRQLSADAFTSERPHGKQGKGGGMTSDVVTALGHVTLIVEAKAARVPLTGQRDFTGYLDKVNRHVGKALTEPQIPTTLGLITSGGSVFADLALPGEVHAFVTTAEPFYMLTSPFYRSQLPQPGCPYTVLSLRELEWFVAAVLHGTDPAALIRALTDPAAGLPESVIASIAGTDRPVNPLLMAAFDQFVAISPAA